MSGAAWPRSMIESSTEAHGADRYGLSNSARQRRDGTLKLPVSGMSSGVPIDMQASRSRSILARQCR